MFILCIRDSSLQGLKMSSVVAYLNEGVTSLQCHLTHMGSWENITVSKRLDTGEEFQVLTVSRGVAEAVLHESVMRDRVYAHVDDTKMYEVILNMWIYVLACGDEGTYVCDADPELDIPTAVGKIQLLGTLVCFLFVCFFHSRLTTSSLNIHY